MKCLHAHLAWYLAGGGDPVGRWVVDELGGRLAGAVAAVDCGTNSTRLLVMAADGTTLERRMIVTRLGEGVDRTGELASAGIERTLAALAEYRELIDAHGVVRVRAAATSAARDAGNSAVFFDAATTVLGVRPELIAGEAEGRLSYKGATAELAAAEGPFLVVDLGGGSTELVAGSATGNGVPGAVVSLDVGCVRVTERFLASDPPGAAELAAARSFVGGVVDAALPRAFQPSACRAGWSVSPARSRRSPPSRSASTTTTPTGSTSSSSRWPRSRRGSAGWRRRARRSAGNGPPSSRGGRTSSSVVSPSWPS